VYIVHNCSTCVYTITHVHTKPGLNFISVCTECALKKFRLTSKFSKFSCDSDEPETICQWRSAARVNHNCSMKLYPASNPVLLLFQPAINVKLTPTRPVCCMAVCLLVLTSVEQRIDGSFEQNTEPQNGLHLPKVSRQHRQ